MFGFQLLNKGCIYHRIDNAPDSPVDEVDNMADTDEADWGNEEEVEVEAIVRNIVLLNHSFIEVVKYNGDIWDICN